MATKGTSTPGLSDLFTGTLPWIAGPAILFPMFPGFLLCIPGFLFAGLFLLPFILIGAVIGVMVAIAAAIVGLVVRVVRSLRGKRGTPAAPAGDETRSASSAPVAVGTPQSAH